MNQLLTARQLADLLAVSVATIYRLSRAGTLPSVRIGGSVRFDPADVQAFVDRQKKALAST